MIYPSTSSRMSDWFTNNSSALQITVEEIETVCVIREGEGRALQEERGMEDLSINLVPDLQMVYQ